MISDDAADEDPTTAGRPGRHGARRTYEHDDIDVDWDATLCIHTGRCIAAAPAVFDPRRRPWVDLGAGTATEIAEAVRRCPTGALRFRSPDPQLRGVEDDAVVEVRPDGPLYVRGDVVLEGAVEASGTRFALCRCGATGNAPFCDNSHKAVGFRSGPNERGESAGDPTGDQVRVRVPTKPGPYRISGARVVTPAGDVLDSSDPCVLCRCGRSGRKPFCDGSHNSP